MAKIDKILGSISPLYGQISGQGLFGQLTQNGVGGIVPQLIFNQREADKEEKARAKAAAGMKHGGKVKKMAKGGSASKRADGCAQRGKTKGKMV